jgi:hypothetical protein
VGRERCQVGSQRHGRLHAPVALSVGRRSSLPKRLGVLLVCSILATTCIGLASAPTYAAGCARPTGSLANSSGNATGEISAACEGQGAAPVTAGSSSGNSSGKPPLCVWVRDPSHVQATPTDAGKGTWYVRFCRFGTYKTYAQFEKVMTGWDGLGNTGRANQLTQAGIRWEYFTAPPPARPTAQAIMASIAGSLPYPTTHLALSPRADRLIVGLDTWVWLTDPTGRYHANRYTPRTKTLTLFKYQLRWQIQPTITINPGTTNNTLTCPTAGIPWHPDLPTNAPRSCRVLYHHSGHYRLTADVAWTIHWSADGITQPDIPGPHKTANLPVTVREVQSIAEAPR